MFQKKAGQKVNFWPKIAPRVERSDPARNSYFPADFLSARLQCSQFLHNWGNIERYMGEGGGERGIDRAQTISLNCGVTHSRGKIEFNCRYFLMTFRKWICKKKFCKNDFHTLQGTMSHRPLTNTSSLKITAAYCIYCTFSLGRGGGGQREDLGATVHKDSSFVHGGNNSQARSKIPTNEWMYLPSIKSFKHNAANSVNRLIWKKSRHKGFGVFKVHSSVLFV